LLGLTKSSDVRSSTTDNVTHTSLRDAYDGHTARINERLARQEKQRAVGVKRAFDNVALFCGVFLRRARMFDAARCEVIDQQGDVTPGYEPVRCALQRRFMQPAAAMKRDDRGKGPITIWLCKKCLEAIARYVLWNVPAFAGKTLLKTTKRLSRSFELDKHWRRCKGVPTKHVHAQH
jgi:hypothetical protein